MINTSSSRILFIDFARGIAILLMLQGHFISTTYQNYTQPHTDSNWLFNFWLIIRGFTAPLFFTVSGMVFMYVLMKNHHLPIHKNQRIKKGILRGLSLIIIGYVLQLNVANIPLYFRGELNDRFFAFHVLNSIGVGLLGLIIIYSIFIKLLKIPGFIVYPIACLVALYISSIIRNIDGNIPSNFPEIIQNAIKGPHSIFPIFPWISYLFFGASLGSIFVRLNSYLEKKWFPILLALGALGVLMMSYILLKFAIVHTEAIDFSNHELYILKQLGYISILLSLFIYLENFLHINTILILMGRNTLTIYVIHIVVLYGAISGIGIKSWWEHSLSGFATILGAIIFIAGAALMTYFQHKSRIPWLKLR